MKSSRSASSQNSRRNARKIVSDSSETENSDNEIENKSFNNMDSAKAERLFSRRRHIKPLERTLFNVSATSGTDTSLQGNTMQTEDEVSIHENSKSTIATNMSNDISSNESEVECNDNSYEVDEESIDDKSKSTISNISNDISSNDDETKVMSDNSYKVDEKDITNNIALENTVANESILMTPKWRSNKKQLFLDSSDDEEEEKTSSVDEKSRTILVSESDDDIINSSNEIIKTPVSRRSEREGQLSDLSLVEPSISDFDISKNKSTISSSIKNSPFLDDLEGTVNNLTVYNPISNSTILEHPQSKTEKHKIPVDQNIQVITLDDDSPIKSTLDTLLQKNQIPTYDLTNEPVNENQSVSLFANSQDTSKKLTSERFQSLQVEKRRLEEIMHRFTKNIDNMKNTMEITNIKLLPDGGLKLKTAIIKEENKLKDTKEQFENVLKQLKLFNDSPITKYVKQSPVKAAEPTNQPNIKAALTKKAAANIDIGAMGDKALSTYRAQQAMTLDVLHSLHKSLKSCPSTDMLADDPTGLKVTLMPHQKHAIAWLLWRENQKPHGGILADDMGLGKTLTMISLILKANETNKHKDSASDSDSDIDNLTDNPRNTIKGGTLVVCPSSLIKQWQNEVKTKLRPRMLEVLEYYGQNRRDTNARKVARVDIVITTYHTVMWDQKNHPNTSPLFQVKWNRIILDEGHTIRNYKSQTSIAVCALHSINRWVLSGTPIHNKEADFYALLHFIKCRPFDDWAVWKRWVGNNDLAGKNRLQLLVQSLMLRRTKAELSEGTSFKLPDKKFHTVQVELFKEEKQAYEKVLEFSSTLFATYLYEKAEKEKAVDRGFPVKNKTKYVHQQDLQDDVFKDHPELDQLFKKLKDNKDIQAHHILVLLLRLRQLCCHPCLMKNMLESDNLKADGIQNTNDLELIDQMSRMSIGIPSQSHTPLTESNPIFNETWVSSKIKSVCDLVNEKVLSTNDKAIIVSQWPSMLLLIGNELAKYRVKTKLFSGSVPVLQRNKIVEEFNNDQNGTKILLLSLTAGGVGLNLVAANHMFLVDVHWNPQLEAQACDRIYRVGQTKAVNVYKFICSNTIETSIQRIQSNKLEIASNLFGGCSTEATKVTLDDLKEIFNMK
ncbi:transcription termination factor 2-like [Adelges cooleyi]|uniref:transcription termination factor 2-like n=1 Tax=Adelges cooleyi TaxID=133065 RepID=UPI00217FB9C3|nr:transcription termination factor 2-like [Adelges cooleyi]XP_050421159.1 transcription termination factor 2-like [Adelges cooleyi]XP_050421160.1 transcription termination factor 2-like [Adelges cooleyi]